MTGASLLRAGDDRSSPSKTLGGLSDRQRQVLVTRLRRACWSCGGSGVRCCEFGADR